jgi:hypothetical protein
MIVTAAAAAEIAVKTQHSAALYKVNITTSPAGRWGS